MRVAAGQVDRIDRQMAISFAALFGALLVLLLVVGTAFYAGIMGRERDQLVSLVGDTLAESIQGVGSTGKYRWRLEFGQLVADNPSLAYISVVDADGMVMAHSNASRNDTVADPEGLAETLQTIQDGQRRIVHRNQGVVDVTEVIHQLRGGYDDQVIGALRIGVRSESLAATLLAGALPIGGLLLLTMGLALPGVYTLSRRLGAPIARQAQELQGILDHAPLVIAMHDQRGRISRASRQLYDTFEVEPGQEPPIDGLIPVDLQDADPADRRELTVDTSAGSRILFTTRFPVMSDATQGEWLGCVMAADVTDLRTASAERDRLIAAVEHADDQVLLLDPDDRIVYANPAFLRHTGLVLHELGDIDAWDILGGNPADHLAQRAALAAGRTWRGRVLMTRHDGTLYACAQVISPVYDPQRRRIGTVVLGRDVTRQEELEQQLRQAQKMEAIGRLAGGVAHDFNNMLTVIIGRTEMLAEEAPPDSLFQTESKVVLDTAMRAAELTGQLLAFSRQQVLDAAQIDLTDVVEGVMPMLHRVIGEDVQLQYSADASLWPVQADRGQMEQVLLNLVVNARDAMPNGGRLRIETRNQHFAPEDVADRPEVTPGDYVALIVSDNGNGIPAAVRDKIFEPFFTTKDAGKGTGLGLATVHGIVKQSGGHVWLYSEEGMGTTFRIHLPRQQAGETKARPRVAPAPAARAAKEESVLVVEDDDAVRATVSSMLRAAGYQTLEAPSARDALVMLVDAQLRPDLVLTDLVMPEMKGTELARRIRAVRPDQRILMMSGYSPEVLDSVDDLAGIELLQKPPSMRALREAVRRTLDTSA